MNFKYKPGEVVGDEGESYFHVNPGFKNYCTIFYTNPVEDIKECVRCDGARLVDH